MGRFVHSPTDRALAFGTWSVGANDGPLPDSKGMALVVTLLVLLVVVALSGALIPLSSTETAIVANHRRAVQALYAAEAALEWAAQELRYVRSWDAVLAGRARSRLWTSASQIRLADGTQLDLRRATGELEQTGAGTSGAGRGLRWQLYASGSLGALLSVDPSNGLLFVVVWLADDSVYTDGNTEEDPSETLALHAAAFGPALAQRAVQATLVRARIDSPATVTDGIGPVATPGPGRVSLRSWRLVR